MSAESTISATSRRSWQEPTAYSKRGWCLRWRMLSIAPVERSSSTLTLWPRASSSSERCEPMKPAPPVIRMRMGGMSSGWAGSWSVGSALLHPAARAAAPDLGALGQGGALPQAPERTAAADLRGAHGVGAPGRDASGVVAHALGRGRGLLALEDPEP